MVYSHFADAAMRLIEFAQSTNTPLAGWYAGIADDPKRRLFSEHDISEYADTYIAIPTTSVDVARQAERALLQTGMDGGPGGGDAATTWVYAFLMPPEFAQQRARRRQIAALLRPSNSSNVRDTLRRLSPRSNVKGSGSDNFNTH